MNYSITAFPLLATGVSCLVIGLASEAETFLWMAPGFIAPGLVLALLGIRHRASCLIAFGTPAQPGSADWLDW